MKLTQPSDATRQELRGQYERDADALIASLHVIATHFATITAH